MWTIVDDLNRAAVFVNVVDCNGFAAAGRRLGMPKATVSKKIGQLEKSLGIRLLNRTTRKIALTEAGARCYAHYAAALEQVTAAADVVQSLKREPDGVLTIAAPAEIGFRILLPAILKFMLHWPRVRINLRSFNELVDLDKHQIDVMLWAGRALPAGHVKRLFTLENVKLFASPGYLEQNPMPKQPEDLASHSFVTYSQGVTDDKFVWRLERNGKRVQVTPAAPPKLTSNDETAVLAAIAAGHGIGGLPQDFVKDAPEGGRLVPVLHEWSAPSIQVGAIFRDASSLKVRLFLEFVAEWFRPANEPAQQDAFKAI